VSGTHSAVTGERYRSRLYPGETDDKRAARLFAYKHALSGSRLGHLVTLAGTELSEVALARDYLGWRPERAWFVDWARTVAQRLAVLANLEAIRRAWPGARAERADVCDVLRRLPLVGFANLDHMGFDHVAMESTRLAVERLAPDGTLSLTWYRGREWVAPHRAAWRVACAARGVVDQALRRRVGVRRLVDRWAREAGVVLEVLGDMDYQHRHAPMSVTVWRRTR